MLVDSFSKATARSSIVAGATSESLAAIEFSSWRRWVESFGRDVDGRPVPPVLRLEALPAGEHARLLAKGRTLFDHCLDEEQDVCILGFVAYELGKNLAARTVLLELLGSMQEDTEKMTAQQDVDRRRRAEHIVDMTVSLWHGLDHDEALLVRETMTESE